MNLKINVEFDHSVKIVQNVKLQKLYINIDDQTHSLIKYIVLKVLRNYLLKKNGSKCLMREMILQICTE